MNVEFFFTKNENQYTNELTSINGNFEDLNGMIQMNNNMNRCMYN